MAINEKRPANSHRAVGIDRADIADAALDLMRTGGLGSVTMRSVADRLGIQAATLYHHFAGKDEILRIVAQQALAGLSDTTRDYDKVENVDDWLAVTRLGGRRARATYLRHPGLASIMLRESTTDRAIGSDPRAELVQAEIRALVRLGVPAEVATQLFEAGARWVLAAIAAEAAVGTSSRRNTQLFDEGFDLVLAGLRARFLDELASDEDDQRS